MNNGLMGGFGFLQVDGSNALVTTEYKSGAGTHFFNASTRWYRALLIGGGGGGGRSTNTTAGVCGGGGGGGETLDTNVLVIQPSVTYEVGAKGTGGVASAAPGTSGGKTRFGPLLAQGGKGGSAANTGGAGGGTTGSKSTPGGGGGTSSGSGIATAHGGRAAGNPIANPANTDGGDLLTTGGTFAASCGYPAGGGSSVYGIGSDGANGAAGSALPASGYGGGGGGGGGNSAGTSGNGGDGSPGYLRIEEYA